MFESNANILFLIILKYNKYQICLSLSFNPCCFCIFLPVQVMSIFVHDVYLKVAIPNTVVVYNQWGMKNAEQCFW